MFNLVLAMASAIGLLVYSSIAVAIAKTGPSLTRWDAHKLLPQRITVSSIGVAGFVFWNWWAFNTTSNTGSSPSAATMVSIFVGLLGVLVPLGVITWAPHPTQQRAWFATIWPIAFPALVLGVIGKFIGMNVVKLPMIIGTYIAEFVNETKEIPRAT